MAYYSHYSPQKRKKMAEAHRTLALMALKMKEKPKQVVCCIADNESRVWGERFCAINCN